MSKESLTKFLTSLFPQSQNFATLYAATDQQVTFVVQPKDSHLRPGNTISGPIMMALADLVAYGCILNTCDEGNILPMAQAVTTNLNINFMHRPKGHLPLYAHGKLLKIGKRLAVCEISIEQTDPQDSIDNQIAEAKLVAHCTCTYALPSLPAPQTQQS